MARAAEAVTASTQAARLASLADNESLGAEDAVATVRRQRDDAVAELEAARRRLDRAAATVRETEQEVLSVQNTAAQLAQQARDAAAAQAAAEEARTQAIEAAGVAITEQLRTQLLLCGKGDLVAQIGGPPVNCSVCDELALPFQARDCRKCRTVVCWGCLSGLCVGLADSAKAAETGTLGVCNCTTPLSSVRDVLWRMEFEPAAADAVREVDAVLRKHELLEAQKAGAAAAVAGMRAAAAECPYGGVLTVLRRAKEMGCTLITQCPGCGIKCDAMPSRCLHVTCDACNTEFCGNCATTHGETRVSVTQISLCWANLRLGTYTDYSFKFEQAGVVTARDAAVEMAKVPLNWRFIDTKPLVEAAAECGYDGFTVLMPGDRFYFYSNINGPPVLLPKALTFEEEDPDHLWPWMGPTSHGVSQMTVLRVVMHLRELATGEAAGRQHIGAFETSREAPDFGVTGMQTVSYAQHVLDVSAFDVATRVLGPDVQGLLIGEFGPSAMETPVKADFLTAKRALHAGGLLSRSDLATFPSSRKLQRMLLTARGYARLVADDERLPADVRLALTTGTAAEVKMDAHPEEDAVWLACVLLKAKPWTVSNEALESCLRAAKDVEEEYDGFNVLNFLGCFTLTEGVTHPSLNGYRDAVIGRWVAGTDIDFDCAKYRGVCYTLGLDIFVNDTPMRRFVDAIHPDFRAVITCPAVRQALIRQNELLNAAKAKPRAARRKTKEPVITFDSDVEVMEEEDSEEDGDDDEDYKPQRKARRK